MTKLNQMLGVKKNVQATAGQVFVEVARASQKAPLINGQVRTYTPIEDGGERFPSESQRVQITLPDLNKQLIQNLSRLFDVTATVDKTNQVAVADLVLPGNLVFPNVPSTTLLWLEKQMADLASYVKSLPILDPQFNWEYDENAGVYRSDTVTTKTQKVQEPIVLYPATDKHAAQTQLISKDQTVGHWTTQRLSGALPIETIRTFAANVQTVREAIVKAKEEANMSEVENVSIGQGLLSFVFSG